MTSPIPALHPAANPKLIVAVDVPTFGEAVALVDKLASYDVIYKLGYQVLYGFGDQIRAEMEKRGAAYFVDAKLHDIPNTVQAAVRSIVRPHCKIVTLHAIGGNDMMQAAVETAAERASELGIEPPKIFAVTLLTSIAPADLGELGLIGGPGENVIRLAALARDARCAGVVCSAHEVRDLKQYFGHEFEALVPGIRPAGAAHGDQKRIATPHDAVEAGADYLVVGRPITEAPDPAAAVAAILAEMSAA